MRVAVVHTGGRYAERVIATLKGRAVGEVTAHQVPTDLPLIIDEPEEFLPSDLGMSETIIAINLHQDLLVEIPHLVRDGQTKALIAPIEDPYWIRPGLCNQVGDICVAGGIEAAFPKPFCALDTNTPAIAEFSRLYRVGKPQYKITAEDGHISEVEVVCGSVCGLSSFVAKKLSGISMTNNPVEKAGVFHHTYPCFASMQLDETRGDTLMHLSVFIQQEAVRQALEEVALDE